MQKKLGNKYIYMTYLLNTKMEQQEPLSLLEVFGELFNLLRVQKGEVVHGSIDLLLDQSETESLTDYVLENPRTLRNILLLIGSDIPGVSEKSVKILINLSQRSEITEELCNNLSGIEYVMDSLREQIKPNSTVPYHVGLNLMLISNLTRHSKGRQDFFNKTKQKKSVYLPYLFECLSNPKFPEEEEMVINILNNFTSCNQGRKFLFETKLGIEMINKICEILLRSLNNNSLKLIERLTSIITHICVDRSLHCLFVENCNIISTICCLIYPDKHNISLRNRKSKNILNEIQNKTLFFDSKNKKLELRHYSLYNNHFGDERSSDIEENLQDHQNQFEKSIGDNMLSDYILKNAIGPIKDLISQDIFDCILVLLSTTEGREIFRKQGGYEVLRIWHLYEKNEEIVKGIENIIHLLVYTEEELRQQDIEINNFQ